MMCFNWNTSPRGMFANKARSLGRALVPLPGEGLVLCPWTSTVEWEDVYGWLYSSDPDLVEQGVGRVAAWKARAIDNLPVAVEITADLAECQLSERRLKVSAFHSLCLSYSMAITRFINSVSDMVVARGWIRGGSGIRTAVIEYGVPSWMVNIRHQGTHALLPSLGEFHAATQYALSWLRANYWRPQRRLIDKQGRSRSATPLPPVLRTPQSASKPEPPVITTAHRDSALARLTFGLCSAKPELLELLVSTDQDTLADYLMNRLLLQLPDSVKYSVTVPDTSNLSQFPVLSGDLCVWRKHLLAAAQSNSSVKQRLASSLIAAIHSTEDVSLRDYLSSWLGLLLVEHYEVARTKQTRMEVVTIVADDDQFLPGTLNWIKLSLVAKDHLGYYSYAISTAIDGHLRSIVPESVREKILYLSKQVALSQRIGSSSYIPGTRQGHYCTELESTLKRCRQKKDTISWEPPTKRARLNKDVISWEPPTKRAQLKKDVKWQVVSNMLPWIYTSIGQCPGQGLSSNFLDLPTSVNKQRSSKSVQRPSSGSKLNVVKPVHSRVEDKLTSSVLSARERVELF